MDLITQGAVGAALTLATRTRSQVAVAAGIGFIAGTVPDLDVLIRDQNDTLQFLEFHRHFSHSLIFIPIGSAFVAVLLYGLLRGRLGISFFKIWLFSALGFGTHGLLDTATSYGTLLLWPFDDTRYSFSIISIVDPLFTLPVIALVCIGIIRKNGSWGRVATIWALIYLLIGTWQNQTALRAAQALADKRGHQAVRLTVKPTFANIILWRSIYEAEGRFYVDAIRPGPWATIINGTSVAKLDNDRDFPWLIPNSTQATDINRFKHVSQDYLAKAKDGSERIIDVRYAFIPTRISALWSIRLSRNAKPNEHAVYETDRAKAREQIPILIRMIFSRSLNNGP